MDDELLVHFARLELLDCDFDGEQPDEVPDLDAKKVTDGCAKHPTRYLAEDKRL
jgi:hypothetical protein